MMIHCTACGISSPRDVAELAQPFGRRCLVCGARLANEVVSSVKAVIALGMPGCRRRDPVNRPRALKVGATTRHALVEQQARFYVSAAPYSKTSAGLHIFGRVHRPT